MSPTTPTEIQPRLLIVDDDPSTVRLLIQFLKDLGQIRFTTDSAAAVEMARAFRPDLILLDVEMPQMDGFRVCAAIKSDPAFEDVPILFVTAHGEADVEARALSAGAIDFISKPPHPPVVRARVRNYLALKQRTDQLRLLSTIDGLTGVANRRAFDTALDLEWRRACRSGEPLALLLLDVDYFKRFNDGYGHQAGDDCLRAVAATLAAWARRPGELAARYGGEEFALLLPACDRQQAADLAEAIRQAVAELDIPHATSEAAPHVTVSVGVATMATVCGAAPCPPGTPCHLVPADLIKAADSGLYEAKRTGRNRVVPIGAP